MAQDPTDSPVAFSWSEWFREWLAILVIIFSLLVIAALSGITIWKGNEQQAKDILGMILPMIGTWVGTVLAFYFGKAQLEAATQSVKTIARELTPEEKLRSIKVTEKMIPRTAAHVAQGEPATLKVMDAVTGIDKEKKGNRLPILTPDDKPVCVIHRSMMDRFIAQNAAAGKTADELKGLTLADLLADPDLKQQVQNTFALVPETATLADAKRAMESIPWCQDVMITRTGSGAEPIIGWITNAIIESNSRV